MVRRKTIRIFFQNLIIHFFSPLVLQLVIHKIVILSNNKTFTGYILLKFDKKGKYNIEDVILIREGDKKITGIENDLSKRNPY